MRCGVQGGYVCRLAPAHSPTAGISSSVHHHEPGRRASAQIWIFESISSHFDLKLPPPLAWDWANGPRENESELDEASPINDESGLNLDR